jgi:hypothetical protein
MYPDQHTCDWQLLHAPCIVKGIEKLTRKVKNLQQQMNEQWNAHGGVPAGMLKYRS